MVTEPVHKKPSVPTVISLGASKNGASVSSTFMIWVRLFKVPEQKSIIVQLRSTVKPAGAQCIMV